ncbi:hypothetical protein PAPYR_575 [Paratrimastix pyriformis]|uniref:Uncharacterized protein n=1 Tax=Paratrimastix pyriformis TaxID=342808 RepID=A0ABQ8UVV0_9EUKA|nr:hypothetical protein PAPYR_575 [Paratrimastix pyriformis]
MITGYQGSLNRLKKESRFRSTKERHKRSVSLTVLVFFLLDHSFRQMAKTTPPTDDGGGGGGDNLDLFGRLPPELLPSIVEASSRPLQTCVQLLSLSRATRVSIRGNLRVLSIDAEPEPILSGLTADALAALVGPCKALRKLSFPKTMTFEGTAASTDVGWVDEAFGGHTQLAVIEQLPSSLPDHVLERILGHLPGLVELTSADRFSVSTRLLAALARSCPGLQVLRLHMEGLQKFDLAALAPISGILKEIDLSRWLGTQETLAAFVGSLSAVTSLKLHSCPHAALEPIAHRLTSFGLCDVLGKVDLPGSCLCRLETLSVDLFTCPPLTRLLAANQATLRRLRLTIFRLEETTDSLAASLRALPHLTHLFFHLGCHDCPASALLPPDVVDRLEELTWVGTREPTALRISSRRLRKLRLSLDAPGLALDCPALVELALSHMGAEPLFPGPRLRTLRVPAAQPQDPDWLLMGPKPLRLRELSVVRLTRPDLLARLCACGSLVRLERLFLDVTRLPNPLVLRLPGQLERLDLLIKRSVGPVAENQSLSPLDLQVEAPGLLDFTLDIPDKSNLPSVRVWLRDCPHLTRLDFLAPATGLLSFQVEAIPRYLNVAGGLDAGSLLGLLTQRGSRLREFTARGLVSVDWPQLLGALSGLPRLTDLDLDVPKACCPLSLACPQLRRLTLGELPSEDTVVLTRSVPERRLAYEAKVVLACPLLEQLRGVEHPSRQLEFAQPAPNLHF